MSWRPIGDRDERYPAWLLALTGKSGTYAIRERGLLGGFTVVYVGESHRGCLRKTLTRHFQSWGRNKTWWTQFFGGSGADPGRTYARGRCEVMVETCPAAAAVGKQAEWISRMRPRDNLLETADVPF